MGGNELLLKDRNWYPFHIKLYYPTPERGQNNYPIDIKKALQNVTDASEDPLHAGRRELYVLFHYACGVVIIMNQLDVCRMLKCRGENLSRNY